MAKVLEKLAKLDASGWFTEDPVTYSQYIDRRMLFGVEKRHRLGIQKTRD